MCFGGGTMCDSQQEQRLLHDDTKKYTLPTLFEMDVIQWYVWFYKRLPQTSPTDPS